jgi:hypothetical protein
LLRDRKATVGPSTATWDDNVLFLGRENHSPSLFTVFSFEQRVADMDEERRSGRVADAGDLFLFTGVAIWRRVGHQLLD